MGDSGRPVVKASCWRASTIDGLNGQISSQANALNAARDQYLASLGT
jgi:hypothetical protein